MGTSLAVLAIAAVLVLDQLCASATFPDSSLLVAVSSAERFACAATSGGPCANAHLSGDAAADLVASLAAVRHHRDVDPEVLARLVSPDPAEASPELVLLVKSTYVPNARTPETLRDLIHAAVRRDPPSVSSALIAHVDPERRGQVMDRLASRNVAVRHHSLQRMAELTSDKTASFFENVRPEVLSTTVSNKAEEDTSLDIIRQISYRLGGRVAVVWTASRADDGSTQDGNTSSSGQAASSNGRAVNTTTLAPGIVSPENKSEETKNVASGTNATNNTNTTIAKTTRMNPPEISVGALSGLIVTALILFMLFSGLLCLYGIQTPSSFAVEREEVTSRRKDQ